MFKKVTEQEIKDAFTELLANNGETTSKDVKDHLRDEGFWVYQKEVSDLLNQVFEELGTTRVNNGGYYVYTPIEVDDDFYGENYEDKDIVDDAPVGDFYGKGQQQNYGQSDKDGDTEPVTGCTTTIFLDNEEDDTEKTKKGKILGDTCTIGTGTWALPIEFDGIRHDLFVSVHNDIIGFGHLVYEVRTPKQQTYYLYSPEYDIITRHRAIYYVWKVLSNEIDGTLKYNQLRSNKAYPSFK